MNTSIGHSKIGTQKPTQYGAGVALVLAAAIIVVLASVLASQTQDTDSAPAAPSTTAANLPIAPEIVPTFYYLVDSEEAGAAILAASNEVESAQHTFFIDMSKPGNHESVQAMIEDLRLAEMGGTPTNTFIVDAR